MTTQAVDRIAEITSNEADRALRMAQRAFAALLESAGPEDMESVGIFQGAQLRGTARRTLSALSADERTRLQRWLALQLAAHAVVDAHATLSRIDAGLAVGVSTALPRAHAALHSRGSVAA